MKCAANRDDIVGLRNWEFLDPTVDQGRRQGRVLDDSAGIWLLEVVQVGQGVSEVQAAFCTPLAGYRILCSRDSQRRHS